MPHKRNIVICKSTDDQNGKIKCPCGYTTEGDVRTANFKMRLHHKVCNEKKKEEEEAKYQEYYESIISFGLI